MPLSDEERKTLEELEASLRVEDPKLARAMGSADHAPQIHRRRAGLAGLGFLAGIFLLLAGIQTIWVLSVLGFVIMVGCTVLALGPWRKAEQKIGGEKTLPRKSPKTGGSHVNGSQDFMNKLEDRWRKRQHDGF